MAAQILPRQNLAKLASLTEGNAQPNCLRHDGSSRKADDDARTLEGRDFSGSCRTPSAESLPCSRNTNGRQRNSRLTVDLQNGAYRDRTGDLLVANQALSQLS